MSQARSVSVTFELIPATPDLTVTSLTASGGTIGGAISMSTTLLNQGSAPAGAFRVGFYFSTDLTITTSDVKSESSCEYSSGLAAGASNVCSGLILVPISLVAVGTYYLGAFVDDQGAVSEGNENNNIRASSALTLEGSFCTGWTDREGSEGGVVECQTQLFGGRHVLGISRDNLTWRRLASPLTGMVEFTAWALPARDANTNFTIRFRSGEIAQGNFIDVGMNETERWRFSTPSGLQSSNVVYKRDWTLLQLVMDTGRQVYSLWIDGTLIAQDVGLPAGKSISGGISGIGVASGRGGAGHCTCQTSKSFS